MARLYANENFPLPVVHSLRRLGHDVLTIQETGRGQQAVSDEEVVRFSLAEKRAVLTLNRKDFIQIHRRDSWHCGIVVCTFDARFEAQAHGIDQALRDAGDLRGKLVRVNRGDRQIDDSQ